MKKTIAIVILIIGCIIALRATKPFQAQTKKVQQNAPCSSNSPACIEILQSNGKVFKFNDFKLLENQCIQFISLPDHSEHMDCGGWQLKWIGPDNLKTI